MGQTVLIYSCSEYLVPLSLTGKFQAQPLQDLFFNPSLMHLCVKYMAVCMYMLDRPDRVNTNIQDLFPFFKKKQKNIKELYNYNTLTLKS